MIWYHFNESLLSTIPICFKKFNYMNYSLYFQADVKKELCWMVTSSLRFTEYVAFDRAFDREQSIFEFFVSPDMEDVFLNVMQKLQEVGVIVTLKKMPNRLMFEPL